MINLSGFKETPYSLSVLFLDIPINQRHSFLEHLKPGIPAHVLSPHKDGIEQVADILNHYQKQTYIANVYIVSRGTPGCLYIGNRTLSLSTLSHYQHILNQLFPQQPFIQPKLCLYGCCIAAGDAGEEFIDRLAEITGVDVIASRSFVEQHSLTLKTGLTAGYTTGLTAAFTTERSHLLPDSPQHLDLTAPLAERLAEHLDCPDDH